MQDYFLIVPCLFSYPYIFEQNLHQDLGFAHEHKFGCSDVRLEYFTPYTNQTKESPPHTTIYIKNKTGNRCITLWLWVLCQGTQYDSTA